MKSCFAAAALSLLSSAALAEAPATTAAGASPEFASHHRFSVDDIAAMADARIAALKAGLKLTPEQEKNWPALETALRDVGKARAQQFAQHREQMMKQGDRDALEALRQRSAMMTTRAAELNKIADAAKPLYDSLDDAQKRRFGMLLQQVGGMRGHRGFFGRRHGFGDDG